MALEGLCDLARDQEARAPVLERDHVSAVDLAQHFRGAVVVRERHDGVRVCVITASAGRKPWEHVLDGRPRARRLLERMRQVVHHLLIAHVLALEKRQDIVHAHAGEVLLLDALQVEPEPLTRRTRPRPR